ncbi:hypothetical protein [Nesterenkonia haasae]|uniref:hypothetical protein n=1 Tax=Nesterenkonia haasae TaxID=2587813 RepID=UPI0013917EFF|nr:hypothetical protein [Nesterenkonia haasae]NDK32796.1 hypothetical protein [Nesterenkonia haasae]
MSSSNSGAVTVPPLEVVKLLQERLFIAGIPSVVGGSGLLASLGLVDMVNDWDLATDAEPAAVQEVLDDLGLSYGKAKASGIFRTEALFKVSAEDHEIDVLVRFAVESAEGIVSIPARSGGMWRGLRMARAQEWRVAYLLLGRDDRAALLSSG